MWSIWLALDPFYLLVCSGGAALGIIWGAMPGLSTSMACALMVGVTYAMPTEVFLAFYLGVLTGSVFGGAISAILINIPGTPDAVPTQMAGHPLALKGEGGLALGTSIIASMIGNWAGIILLVLCIPIALKMAMKFSSWEVGLLALWGVSICGTLIMNERPIKGWISGWIGLLLAMVGRDVIHGYERLTFGNRELLLGIPYIPVLIGLFGLTEIFYTLADPSKSVIPQKVGKMIPPMRVFFRYWKTIIRSAIVGLIVGIIPGAGANVATFISYGLGEQITKKKFGVGDLEGVMCSEVANNAVIGGALLPTLTLGIPGGAASAAFIAAMGLHGVIVGPTISAEQPGLVYFIFGLLIIANFAMYGWAFALIKPSVKLFSLPKELLLPTIVLMCVCGSFAEKLAIFDVYLAFGMGLLGYIMRLAGFPVGPMVLGCILGKMVDENLRRSMVVFKDMSIWQVLIDRPFGTVLIIIVILTFIAALKRKPAKYEDLKT